MQKVIVVIQGGCVVQAFSMKSDISLEILDLDQMDDLALREEHEQRIELLQKRGSEIKIN